MYARSCNAVFLGAVVALSACTVEFDLDGLRDCQLAFDDDGWPICRLDVDAPFPIIDPGVVDILFVVDNSGSMREEHEQLVSSFATDDCPITPQMAADFERCYGDAPPEICRYFFPTVEQLAGELAGCGFLQVLAAFDIDFRVGVITTDVGMCDNRYPDGQGGDAWGFRPQRGCLQPDGPLGVGEKVISRDDLRDGNGANDDLALRFQATLQNVGLFGTPVERGLDAMKVFLEPDSHRAPGCENDLELFLRDNAHLVVIFLSDEDDCSRLPGDEIFACPQGEVCDSGWTEFTGETCGEFVDHFTNFPPSTCYERFPYLTGAGEYAQFLRELKGEGNVHVAAIAGGLDTGQGVSGGACRIDERGAITASCVATWGNSNTPDCADDEANCCTADAGDRYFAVANALGGVKGSICALEYKDTLRNLARDLGGQQR